MTKPTGQLLSWERLTITEVKKLFNEVVATFGKLNIAINNVGKVLKKPIVETTEEEYDEMYFDGRPC